MGENVIRQDIVQIDFNVTNNPFPTLISQINQFYTQVSGDLTSVSSQMNSLSGSIRDISNTSNLSNINNSLNNISNETQISSNSFRDLASEIQSANIDCNSLNETASSLTSSLEVDKAKQDMQNLTSQLQVENGVLQNLQQEYESVVEEQGEMSSSALVLQRSILNTQNNITQMARTADLLGNSISNAEEEIERLAREQQNLKPKTFTEMLSSAKDLAKQKFDNFKQLGQTSVEKLKNGLIQMRNINLSSIAKGLDSGLGLAIRSSGKLLKGLTKLAGISFKGLLNGISAVASKASKMASTLGKGVLSVGNGITKATSMTMAGATTIVSGIGGYATKVGMEFEAGMSEVAALKGLDTTSQQFEKLETTAKKFGSTTKFSATESAEALKYMALASWETDQMCDGLGGVLNLAAASGMELGSASDVVTDYLSAFNMKASESNKLADMMCYAQANSNTSVEQLSEAYKNCAANMNASGQDVQTTTSLLAMMANQGYKGSEAGTALTAIMRDMTNSMKNGAISIGKTKVQVMDSNGNYRDMVDILKDVESATDGMGDAQKSVALSSAFTSDSIKGLNLILNAGVGTAEEFRGKLEESGGTAEEMAEKMNDNLKGRLTELSSATEGLGLAVYDNIFEPMKDVVKEAGGWMSELTKATEKGGLNGLLKAVGKISVKVINTITKYAPKLIESGVSMVKSLIKGIRKNLPKLTSGIMNIGMSIAEGFTTIMPKLVSIGFDIITNLINGIRNNLPRFLNMASNCIVNFSNTIIKKGPILIQTGANAIRILVIGIVNRLPDLISLGVNVLFTLTDSIIQSLPMLVNCADALINSLGTALITNLPIIIQAGMDLMQSLVSAITELLPALIPVAINAIIIFANSIVSQIPTLVQCALTLISTLVQTLFANLPLIIEGGVQIIVALGSGLVQAIPMIIQTIVELVPVIVSTLIANLPLIIEGGVQIIVALGSGLVQAIPQLLGMIPKVIEALVNAILNTNWLDVGSNIIKGIGNGIVNGVKSVFGGSKKSGEKVGKSFTDGIISVDTSTAIKSITTATNNSFNLDTTSITNSGVEGTHSLATGITSNIAEVESSSIEVSKVAENSLKLNNNLISSYGTNGTSSLSSGIISDFSSVKTAGNEVSKAAENSLELNANAISSVGSKYTSTLASGITSSTNDVTNAVGSLTSEVNNVANKSNSKIKVKIVTNDSNLNDFVAKIENIVKSSTERLKGIPKAMKSAMNKTNENVLNGMTQVNSTVEGKLVSLYETFSINLNGIKALTFVTMTNIKTLVNSCNLYSSGQNIVDGLRNGILSKKEQLFNDVKAMANGITTEVNKALDIHSPSRKMIESGEYTTEGMAIGMENKKPELSKISKDLTDEILVKSNLVTPSISDDLLYKSPYIPYFPESANTSYNNSNTNTNMSFNPTVTININDNNKNSRKVAFDVKRAVKEALEEAFLSMNRTTPALSEI